MIKWLIAYYNKYIRVSRQTQIDTDTDTDRRKEGRKKDQERQVVFTI